MWTARYCDHEAMEDTAECFCTSPFSVDFEVELGRDEWPVINPTSASESRASQVVPVAPTAALVTRKFSKRF